MITMSMTDSAHKHSDWATAGAYYCAGSCYPVSCATVALLKSTLKPRLLLSTSYKAATGSLTVLSLPYGVPVAFGLLPCTSSGV